jgi:hypothetical protein
LASRLIYPVNIRTPVAETKFPAHYLQNTVYIFVDAKDFVKKEIWDPRIFFLFSILSPFFTFMGCYIFVYTFRGFRVLLDPFLYLNPFFTYTRIYGHRRAWDTHSYIRRTAADLSTPVLSTIKYITWVSHRVNYVRRKYPPHTGQVLTTFIINCM